MKNLYSRLIFVMGLGLLYLTLKKNPDDWKSIIVTTFFGVVIGLLFLYFRKKRRQ